MMLVTSFNSNKKFFHEKKSDIFQVYIAWKIMRNGILAIGWCVKEKTMFQPLSWDELFLMWGECICKNNKQILCWPWMCWKKKHVYVSKIFFWEVEAESTNSWHNNITLCSYQFLELAE
jgi:hypothetical protein